MSRPQGISSLNATDEVEAMVIDCLTMEQYHRICYWDLSQPRIITISTNVTVNICGVFTCSSEDPLQDWVEIASLQNVDISTFDWVMIASSLNVDAKGEVMDNGWTRYVFCLTGDLSQLNFLPKFQLW
jgi:hypothetical protein